MGSLPNLTEIGRDDDLAHEWERVVKVRAHASYRYYEAPPPIRPRRKVYSARWPPIDDLIMHPTASSSPASARSHLAHMVNTRKRDSLTSSIGATSVRRLISVVRNSHHRPAPLHSRRAIIAYLIAFCVAHFLLHATLWPFLALQGALSAWTRPLPAHPITVNVGSALLSLLFLSGALSSLAAPHLVHQFGFNVILLLFYVIAIVYYVAHAYPLLVLLVPLNVVMGVAVGQAWLAQVVAVMALAAKMHSGGGEEEEELRVARRTVVVRRFARAVQAAQDLGLSVGSTIAAFVVNSTWLNREGDCIDETTFKTIDCVEGNCTLANATLIIATPLLVNCSAHPGYVTFDRIFDVDEHGHRVCGAHACATHHALPEGGVALPPATPLLLPLLFAALVACGLVVLVVGVRRLGACTCHGLLGAWRGWGDVLRTVQDTFGDRRLKMAAPLAVFIGLEQAFIVTDFSKSYVVCTLGVQHLNLVFLSMGLLQSIAACTLSMLLKSIQRFYVVGVGFVFHACVLMVQMLWKPINDDPALFYVIPAVWGVCNAIWELLNYSLFTALYTDNCGAPFANTFFFRFVGLAIGFASHGLLCNWMKLYVLGVALMVAVVPFFWLEVKYDRAKRGQTVSCL